jgi:uncharacterized membrane protein YraQ (UPF0718 family)
LLDLINSSAVRQTINNIKMTVPIIIGIIFFIGLILQLVPASFYSVLGNENNFIGVLAAAIIGGVVAGNPSTSYVLGGEFLSKGISFSVVSAFLVAWVTIGFIQLPAEGAMLGKRFALVRNALAFISAVLIGCLTFLFFGWFA